MTVKTPKSDRKRPRSPLLATAIIAVPLFFVRFLLRKGYAPSTGRVGFVYAGVVTLVGVVARLGW